MLGRLFGLVVTLEFVELLFMALFAVLGRCVVKLLFVGLAGTAGGLLLEYPMELVLGVLFSAEPELALSSLAGTKFPVELNFWGFGGAGGVSFS